MKIALVIGISVTVFLLSGGYYVFMKACHRERELHWEDPLSLGKSQWAPLADKIAEVVQYLNDHNTLDVYTVSNDGLSLRARWLPAEDAKGTILLFHGYRSCGLSDFSMVIPLYHGMGFNLLIADQRSHGKSEGNFITFGIWEHRDVLRWIAYHNDNFGKLPVYLGGMSMGATTVLMAAGRELPDNVRGVIADCGFTEPYEIIAQVMASVHVPAFPLLQIAGWYTKIFAGFGLREYSTVRAMDTCKVPVILLHGTEDHFVPCRMSKAAFDACHSEKQLLLVDGASHGTSFPTDRSRCEAALTDFLLGHLTN